LKILNRRWRGEASFNLASGDPINTSGKGAKVPSKDRTEDRFSPANGAQKFRRWTRREKFGKIRDLRTECLDTGGLHFLRRERAALIEKNKKTQRKENFRVFVKKDVRNRSAKKVFILLTVSRKKKD